MEFKNINIEFEKKGVEYFIQINTECNSVFVGSSESFFYDLEEEDLPEGIFEDLSHIQIFGEGLNSFYDCYKTLRRQIAKFEEMEEIYDLNENIFHIYDLLLSIDNKNLKRDLYCYFDEVED